MPPSTDRGGPASQLACGGGIMERLLKLRIRHFIVIDLILLGLAVYMSYVLRLENFDLTDGLFLPSLLVFVTTALIFTPLVFWWTGVYFRYWRYASIEELVLLTVAMTIATMLTGVISRVISTTFFAEGTLPVPRSIPFIFLLLALAAAAAPRLALRVITGPRPYPLPYKRSLTRVIIVGAGDAGALIAREIRSDSHLGMQAVAFIDDDPHKHNVRIRGILVVGGREMIPDVVRQHAIDQVIIAMPTAPGKTVRQILDICEQVKVQARTVPGVYELIGGTVSISQLREIQVEDLLRREPVQTDIATVTELLRGKRVLVTGAGGSIGSELCRQIMRCGVKEMILLGHGENSIFDIYHELQRRNAGIKLVPVIADVRFAERIQQVFEDCRPEVVFHAAAHKHVPLMEANPGEAILNNVFGTRNVLAAAEVVGVEHFVMISTDKAVNPTSVMGASKRVAELLVQQVAHRTGKPYMVVRFGNVLGSRGSVIPTFKQQIASGGPVTVTHPDMQRYFMTIPEAVQLVLQAAVLGHGGEVYMLDMGEPVKIVDLAHDLIELSGLKVGQDIDIRFIGMRPGEKLFEELVISSETYQDTAHPRIFRTISTVPPAMDSQIEQLREAGQSGDKKAIYHLLQYLVREFHPAGDNPEANQPAPPQLAITPSRVSVGKPLPNT